MTQTAKRLTAEARRQAVLDTACRVFSRSSYRGATTAEIAREAGISEPILYRHFGSKRDLYLACMDEAWGSFRAVCEEALAGDPSRSLGAIADAYMVRGRKIRVIDLWIQGLDEASEDKLIAAAVRKQIREVHDFFADVIRDGQEGGSIHADRDPVAEAWIFVAGGLLATIDGRLGGLLGDDLQALRASRQGWMMAAKVSDT
jgi:AcrR family transcriptional regulator